MLSFRSFSSANCATPPGIGRFNDCDDNMVLICCCEKELASVVNPAKESASTGITYDNRKTAQTDKNVRPCKLYDFFPGRQLPFLINYTPLQQSRLAAAFRLKPLVRHKPFFGRYSKTLANCNIIQALKSTGFSSF
jgi:hypothetical protein